MQDFQNQYGQQYQNYDKEAMEFYNKILNREKISNFYENTKNLIVNPQDRAAYDQELFINEDKAYRAVGYSKTGLILGIIYASLALIFLFISFIVGYNINYDYSGLLFLYSIIIMCFANALWIPTTIFSVLGLVKSKACNIDYKYKSRKNSIIGLCCIGLAILLIIISFIVLAIIVKSNVYQGYNSPIY